MKHNKKIYIFFTIGLIFVIGFGALSHFFYEWSEYNEIIGILFPANESTWEHLKLAIFPTIIYFVIASFSFKNTNYIFAFFITLLLPMILTPCIFYIYTFFTNKSILIVDIITFVVSVIIAWLCCLFILKHNKNHKILDIIGAVGIVTIVVCYLLFTSYPPNNFLFEDPITKSFGLKNI